MLAFEEAEERNAFEWNDEFLASLGEVTTEMLHQKLRKLGYKVKLDVVRIPDAKALMKELSVLLDKFGIGGLCEAFVIDCDLAKDWKKLQLKEGFVSSLPPAFRVTADPYNRTTIYKDQIRLKDYEVVDGMFLDLVGVVDVR